ncbi:MAG: hypothetical protein ABI306_07960 [Caulobacteraceae bacterium]
MTPNSRQAPRVVMAWLFLALAAVLASAGPVAAGPGALRPPAIPARGAYLGAWVNPRALGNAGQDEPGLKEIGQLAPFNSAVGKPLAILHLFSHFHDPLPVQTLAAIEANGSIPLLNWSCASLPEINSGRDDTQIAAFAHGVARFGKPLFLRWYWEMNLDDAAHKACGAAGDGPAFISAWRRIWNIFRQAGATNAAFVWCPSARGDSTPYYPGDAYVDWIAADKFDKKHHGQIAFAQLFGPFFASWASHDKPFMVGATGAQSVDQAQFLQGIQKDLPARFPRIKAVIYFDATGPKGDWSLQGPGLAAFKALAADPYFSVR